MPSFRSTASPGLRATQALPLAGMILLAVFFGTPGRDQGQVARAQSPELSTPRARRRRTANSCRRPR